MQHRRCIAQVALLCLVVLTSAAAAQSCGGCLEAGCLECGPLAPHHFGVPFLSGFCERPPACFGTISLDLVALERTGGDYQDVLFVGVNPVANVRDLNFSTKLGFRADLILPGDAESDFNFNLFRTGNDRALATREGAGLTFVFFDAFPAVPASSYTMQYKADLTSVEANLRMRTWPRLASLVGFRVFDLSEEFNILETGTNTGFFSGTDNELYGFQIGGQALILQKPRWRIESLFKAGVFYNDIRTTAEAANGMLLGDFTRTSFAGELQVTFMYQLGPRMLLRTGYQALWLSSVAKAPDQSDDGSFATGLLALDTGQIAYHGGFLGLEITW